MMWDMRGRERKCFWGMSVLRDRIWRDGADRHLEWHEVGLLRLVCGSSGPAGLRVTD